MTHNQSWFEMSDVKSDVYGNGEWTPLWAYEVSRDGDMFSAPYTEEIYRVRTLFAPVQNKAYLFFEWHDLDSDNLFPVIDRGNYCKAWVYYRDSSKGDEAGEFPVFKYITKGSETSEPVVNQDLIASLGLVCNAEGNWIRPAELGKEIIKVGKDSDGEVCRINIRTEHLRDYLAARGMGLYVEEFRHRQEHSGDGNAIAWKKSPVEEYRIAHDSKGKYVWKGWMFEHESDMLWKDATKINERVLSLPQYYRVEGQLWKQFWIVPASKSEIIGGDSSELSYYVSPNAEKREISPRDDDEYGHVYLFFSQELPLRMLDAGLNIKWKARDVFGIEFPCGETPSFGISNKGNYFAISADIARLEGWAQRLLHGVNILPEEQGEYEGSELFHNQMMCEFLRTAAPEDEFVQKMETLEDVFRKRTGVDLWQDIDTADYVISNVTRFGSTNQQGYVTLARFITNAMIERISVEELKKFIAGRIETVQLKSIGLFAASLKLVDSKIDEKSCVEFMRKINILRQADAHLMSGNDIADRLNAIPMGNDIGWVEKGARLIEFANNGLQGLIDKLEM